MTLQEYKDKNGLTFKDLEEKFKVSINKLWRWNKDGAVIKRINGRRCIVLTRTMAVEVNQK